MQLGGVLYELLLLEYTYELVCMVYRILPRNIIIYYAYYTCTPSSIHTECMYVCMYVIRLVCIVLCILSTPITTSTYACIRSSY